MVLPIALPFAFSIRIRIESSATLDRGQVRHAVQAFQYPHSDRIICNKRPGIWPACRTSSFSIRIRIESSATYAEMLLEDEAVIFQYPHSDRIICNPLP